MVDVSDGVFRIFARKRKMQRASKEERRTDVTGRDEMINMGGEMCEIWLENKFI
jgi:hypothetical protein